MFMTELSYTNSQVPQRQPRLKTGIILVLIMWAVIKVPGWIAPVTFAHIMGAMWGPALGVLTVLIWWLALSRMPWRVKLMGLAGLLLTPLIAYGLGDKSMRM